MKGTSRTKTIVTVFVLSCVVVGGATAFAGSAFGFQTNHKTAASESTDSPATLNSSPAVENFTCDSGENATIPMNCDVYLTVVPMGTDKQDDLAGFRIRNDGGGDFVDNLSVRYETNQGESGAINSNYFEVNTTDNGSVTVDIYYDGKLVRTAQSDTDTTLDLGPPNDSNDNGNDNADDGGNDTTPPNGSDGKDC